MAKEMSRRQTPFLEPLQIIAVRYVDSVRGVVLKLRMPNGSEALAYTSHVYLDNVPKDAPLLERISGSLQLL